MFQQQQQQQQQQMASRNRPYRVGSDDPNSKLCPQTSSSAVRAWNDPPALQEHSSEEMLAFLKHYSDRAEVCSLYLLSTL
jgi:hypothetical protein